MRNSFGDLERLQCLCIDDPGADVQKALGVIGLELEREVQSYRLGRDQQGGNSGDGPRRREAEKKTRKRQQNLGQKGHRLSRQGGHIQGKVSQWGGKKTEHSG